MRTRDFTHIFGSSVFSRGAVRTSLSTSMRFAQPLVDCRKPLPFAGLRRCISGGRHAETTTHFRWRLMRNQTARLLHDMMMTMCLGLDWKSGDEWDLNVFWISCQAQASLWTLTHTHSCVCVYVYIYRYVSIYIDMYLYIYTNIYIYIHLCIYIYT